MVEERQKSMVAIFDFSKLLRGEVFHSFILLFLLTHVILFFLNFLKELD